MANVPPRTATLCEPFLGWELPVRGATVVYCDERRMELHFPTGRADELGPEFRLAVRTAGWTEDVDSTAQGLVNVRYTQAGEVLDLSAIDGHAHTSVILTRDPAPTGGTP